MAATDATDWPELTELDLKLVSVVPQVVVACSSVGDVGYPGTGYKAELTRNTFFSFTEVQVQKVALATAPARASCGPRLSRA
eukprot:619082-Rhodomonas_salina.2